MLIYIWDLGDMLMSFVSNLILLAFYLVAYFTLRIFIILNALSNQNAVYFDVLIGFFSSILDYKVIYSLHIQVLIIYA